MDSTTVFLSSGTISGGSGVDLAILGVGFGQSVDVDFLSYEGEFLLSDPEVDDFVTTIKTIPVEL